MAKIRYKKSLLFTISIVMVISTLLGLAFLVYDNTFHSKARAYEFSLIDNINSLDSSLQSSFRDIFTVASGINISKDNLSISFAEQLPNRQAQVFNATISDFFRFAMNQTNNELPVPMLHLYNDSISKNMTLLISPYNLVYTHLNGYGENHLSIVPLDSSNINVSGYHVKIITSANVSDCDDSPILTGDGSLNLSISVDDLEEGMNGCGNSFVYPYSIINKSLTKLSSVGYIQFKNTSNDLLFTVYYTNGELNIAKESDVEDSLINITVQLIKISDNPIEVKTYDKIIGITYDDYSKLSSVTLLP